MAKWRKKALVVTAVPLTDMALTDTYYVTTLEGVSEGTKGDYLVTGVDNEQWIVKPKWFKQYYRHLQGDTYQRIPMVLEATQITEPEVVKAPTGDIKGDPGDYKVTGKKGEHWFVKPDIFEKTYERVGTMHTEDKNTIQKSIDQIGLSAVERYLPKGMRIHPCDIHGHFLAHYTDENPICPLCIKHNPQAEGTNATDVELYIDLRDSIRPPTNPHN
ncbi:hypothetical protein D1872_51450 [compost metagenome]